MGRCSTQLTTRTQASCFTVTNLYWNQPVLNKIADSFQVSHEQASTVATMIQAGYAGGLLFICPIGDMVRRRPFNISLVVVTLLMVRVCHVCRVD
jgi:predicted MFS family arabinose efflux permease